MASGWQGFDFAMWSERTFLTEKTINILRAEEVGVFIVRKLSFLVNLNVIKYCFTGKDRNTREIAKVSTISTYIIKMIFYFG